MDTRLTFCPLHLQQWMTFSRFFVSFFCFPLPHHLADHIHQIKDLPIVWQRLELCSCWGGSFFLFYKHTMYRNYTHTGYVNTSLFHCCKQSIQVSHIHYAYVIITILILIIVVVNILFIHKSWQQIRHGDAHDGRTQNSKAVQKNELVFTFGCESVFLSAFLSNGQLHRRLFCLVHFILTRKHFQLTLM